jgi:3-oxoacyl-[acyl-carrier protein] reductase
MNILITGGSSGLGRATVEKLAKLNGFTIYFTYANSIDAAKKITTEYPNTRSLHCNFSDPASVDELVRGMATLDIDILINNASAGFHKDHFHKIDSNIIKNSFETNVLPVLKITAEAIKIFRKKKSGKIITILSSYTIDRPPVGLSEYVANKTYLLSMSKSWATENIRFNITSNCISPSFMETNFTADTDERIVSQMKEEHPLKALLTTTEVADALLFYINASQQVNGTNMIINAGTSLI